ncbi:MAG: 3-deoxy-manno-octulosonate cytidylyltransferase [Candidatus Eisenbacteria bacterium]
MVVGVVPARLGSTRFPGKVLETVCGKPLVLHAYERLREATSVGRVLIATDSAEVERAARHHGAEVVVVTEPCASGTDRVALALASERFDIAVNLQADQPLISPSDIDRAVSVLDGDEALDMTTLAYPDSDPDAFESRDVVKVVVDATGLALYFSRAPIPSAKCEASANPLFLHHVGIYCIRRGALERFAELPRGRLEERESLEQLRALESGMTIGVVQTEHARPEVDRPSDLRRIEDLLGER